MCLNNELPSSCVLLIYTFVTFWFCSLFILFYALDVVLVPFLRYMIHSVITVHSPIYYMLNGMIHWTTYYMGVLQYMHVHMCALGLGVDILWRFPLLAASLVFKWQFTKMDISSGWWCFLFNLRVSDINSNCNRWASQAVKRFPVLLEAFFFKCRNCNTYCFLGVVSTRWCLLF